MSNPVHFTSTRCQSKCIPRPPARPVRAAATHPARPTTLWAGVGAAEIHPLDRGLPASISKGDARSIETNNRHLATDSTAPQPKSIQTDTPPPETRCASSPSSPSLRRPRWRSCPSRSRCVKPRGCGCLNQSIHAERFWGRVKRGSDPDYRPRGARRRPRKGGVTADCH